MKKSVLLVSLLFSVQLVLAQNLSSYKVHSHNDYLQSVPFWKAFGAGANSVEADLFLEEGSLYVAHTRDEINKSRDFERLYLEPIQQSIALDLGFDEPFQLLVDIKSEAYSTLDTLVNTLKKYPSIIDAPHISIVISGHRPKPSDYVKYPSYILFDHQSLNPVEDAKALDKIALISLSFKGITDWNGKGRLTAEDLEKVKSTIDKAHVQGKPFRFWATPDSKTAWKALAHLGVDYINTDMPFECRTYLSNLPTREYRNTIFSEVYRPTFETDKKKKAPENVILMIGDGNGLTQISAAVLANKGETNLSQLKSIGFIKTQSADDFTTDSAGAGTALATGKKAANRAIGMTMDGKKAENLTELLSKKGYVSGLVTTDEIAGATPASFYAHQKDRSSTDAILAELSDSKISLFVSTDRPKTFSASDYGGFTLLPSLDEIKNSTSDKIACFMHQGDDPDPNQDELSIATENALGYLQQKNKPFFLMVEGAKIDSYGHSNQIDGVIKEGIGFDKAIAKALRYADVHKNTLVVITADHETGGLTLPQGNLAKNEIEGDFTTNDHTATMVPIFAYGPRSDLFQGVYENNKVFHKIIEALNLKD